MPRRKDISNDLKIAMKSNCCCPQSGKDYTAKQFEVHHSTVDYSQLENIKNKLPRSGRPKKITPW